MIKYGIKRRFTESVFTPEGRLLNPALLLDFFGFFYFKGLVHHSPHRFYFW
jgi:hypothetical protein